MAAKKTKADLEREILKLQAETQPITALSEKSHALQARLCTKDAPEIEEFCAALDMAFWTMIEKHCCSDVRSVIEDAWRDCLDNIENEVRATLNI